MTLVDFGAFPTCLAFPDDMLIFDDQLCFGIFAFTTQNELVDKDIEKVLQLFFVVGSVDDVTLRGTVSDDFCLSAEFETEELGDVDGGTSEIVGYVHDIGNNCFDAVALSFDLLWLEMFLVRGKYF